MTTPDQNSSPTRRRFTAPLLLAAAVALLGSLFFVTGNPASAQATADTTPAATVEAVETVVVAAPAASPVDTVNSDPIEVEDDYGIEEMMDELFDEDTPAEFMAFEECVTTELADLDETSVGSAIEAAITAADEVCAPLLPAEVQAELAAFDTAMDDFETCLTDNGVDMEALMDIEVFEDEDYDDFFGENPGGVSVWNEDGVSDAQFGPGDGTVTITKTDAGITVTSTGDVTITEWSMDDLDHFDVDSEWAEYDEAFAACDPIIDAVELDFLNDLDDEDDDN